MPVSRRDMKQTSYMRKVFSYTDTLERGLAKRRFGFDGFQILTVTKSKERIKSIQDCIRLIGTQSFSANTFLFNVKDKRQSHFAFHSTWVNCNSVYTNLIIHEVGKKSKTNF